MVERPGAKYAISDGLSIAYTRFGQGDEIVVFIPPWVSNIELVWDVAEYRRALERSAQHHQVIQIDKRGMGLSDRTNTPPTMDDRITDTLAVLDAEGIGRSHLLGFSEAGPVAVALASRHPERVASLLLVGSLPIGAPVEEVVPFVEPDDPVFDGMAQIEEILATWGTDECPAVKYFFPSAAGDQRVEAWHRRYERQSASPGALRAHLQSAMEMEFTDDVTTVACPVFIGHSRGDRMVPVAAGRYLAHRFPDATVRFWDAQDHDFVFSPDWADIQSDLIEFVTGTRPAPVARGRFGVVLFTDIVGSTAEAIAAGDDRWARLIAAHDAVADLVIDEYAGRRVKSTGDGLLAIFDDPVNAVECAGRLLDRFAEIGLQVRAGLHAGQVQFHDDGDISGTAVNIAARVEPLADAGCICVSRTMADLLLGEDIAFDALGEHKLKGIDQPIEVYALAAR